MIIFIAENVYSFYPNHVLRQSLNFAAPELFEIEKKPWGGSREILVRKRQVPMKEYLPKDIIRICLLALQTNDDPQLDHGSSVVLEFKSNGGLLAQGKLDPSEYGRFLRTTEPYNSLIDFKSAELVGQPEKVEGAAEESIRQCVRLKSYEDISRKSQETYFDFYLSKANDLWLVDVILHRDSSV